MFKYVLVAPTPDHKAYVVFGNSDAELMSKLKQAAESEHFSFEAFMQDQADYGIDEVNDFVSIYDVQTGHEVSYEVTMIPVLRILQQ